MAPLRIAAIALHPLHVPMARPIKMAGETLSHAQTLLACVHDEAGRSGWGEASSAPLMTGETLASLADGAALLAARLAGCTLAGPAVVAPLLAQLLPGRPSLHAVFETALMDLFAQRAGWPLHQLLRQMTRQLAPPAAAPEPLQPLPMLHMLASGDLEAERAEAAVWRAQGVRHWKIKVGTPGADGAALDARRIELLCADLQGDTVSADANMALSADAARLLAHTGARAGLAFLEQPFAADALAAAAQLHRASGLPLCADESIQQRSDIDAHDAAGAAQGASLKLIKLGGTLALLQAGRHALQLGWRLNLACKVAETTVSAAASAHAGFALGALAWGFSMSNRYLRDDVCAAPLQPRHGAVHAAQLNQAGLGFSPDAQRLRSFAAAPGAVREFLA